MKKILISLVFILLLGPLNLSAQNPSPFYRASWQWRLGAGFNTISLLGKLDKPSDQLIAFPKATLYYSPIELYHRLSNLWAYGLQIRWSVWEDQNQNAFQRSFEQAYPNYFVQIDKGFPAQKHTSFQILLSLSKCFDWKRLSLEPTAFLGMSEYKFDVAVASLKEKGTNRLINVSYGFETYDEYFSALDKTYQKITMGAGLRVHYALGRRVSLYVQADCTVFPARMRPLERSSDQLAATSRVESIQYRSWGLGRNGGLGLALR